MDIRSRSYGADLDESSDYGFFGKPELVEVDFETGRYLIREISEEDAKELEKSAENR